VDFIDLPIDSRYNGKRQYIGGLCDDFLVFKSTFELLAVVALGYKYKVPCPAISVHSLLA
jgi:hypothetical protein